MITPPLYIQYLSPAERAGSLRIGMLQKLAERGLNKQSDFSDWPANILKGIIGTALVTGIPLGAVAHMVGQRLNSQTLKERELSQSIKYYRNAAQQMEQGLAQPTE